MAKKCSHEDTRLSCIECNKPICSACLVQCPVGFRCRTCVGSAAEPVKASAKMLMARLLALSSLIGFGAGWLIPLVQIPFLGCIICFFVGLLSGRWLAKFIDYSIAGNPTRPIVFGVLLGMMLTPYFGIVPAILGILQSSFMGQVPIFDGLNAIVSGLFSPVCLFVGILKATVWGEHY